MQQGEFGFRKLTVYADQDCLIRTKRRKIFLSLFHDETEKF